MGGRNESLDHVLIVFMPSSFQYQDTPICNEEWSLIEELMLSEMEQSFEKANVSLVYA